MQTIGERFMYQLKDALRSVAGGDCMAVRSDGSTDLLGRVDVIVKDSLHTSVLQFTYHFGPHSWHPVIIHASGQANEDIQVFRWNAIDRALEAIIAGVRERAPLMI
jgi:hypothetical protein